MTAGVVVCVQENMKTQFASRATEQTALARDCNIRHTQPAVPDYLQKKYVSRDVPTWGKGLERTG